MEMSKCLECGVAIPARIPKRPGEPRLYCSSKCGAKYWWRNRPKVTHHNCRFCGVEFPIKPDQGNKWLCSPACRRGRVAKITREWHIRHPERTPEYRAKQKAKQKVSPDGNIKRFFMWNPHAPRACESCGEDRVLEVAHKPAHRRFGEGRRRWNSHWPQMVWVLCPTCHRLIDRMGYSPEELGLKEECDLPAPEGDPCPAS